MSPCIILNIGHLKLSVEADQPDLIYSFFFHYKVSITAGQFVSCVKMDVQYTSRRVHYE